MRSKNDYVYKEKCGVGLHTKIWVDFKSVGVGGWLTMHCFKAPEGGDHGAVVSTELRVSVLNFNR